MVKNWDIFLSYASEDKGNIADPLVEELEKRDLKVWFDAFSLTPGHSLRRSIEYGLSRSEFGVFLLSKHFFNKEWPQQELDAMFALGAPLIPVLHEIDISYVRSKSSILASRVAISGADGLIHIADKIEKAIRDRKESKHSSANVVLCVGSAVGESVLRSPKLELGQKNLGDRKELLGGSAFNHVSRLLSMGYPAVPILSVGRDRIGERIQAHILGLLECLPDPAIAQRLAEFVRDDNFFCKGIKTIESTIIVSGNQRTIFTGKPVNIGKFKGYVEQRVHQLEHDFADLHIGAIMIGHIYSDNKKLNKKNPGATTSYLLNKYKDRFIFTNFGQSQIELEWEKPGVLDNISVFQLSMTEVREFYRNIDESASLEKIIELFREDGLAKANMVITLDKFGALAVPNDREGLYVAWPYDVPNIIDTTGAGDAFGAGLVAMRHVKKKDFHSALEEARMWAAFACTTLGGAHECPNGDKLKEFKTKVLASSRSKGTSVRQVEFRELDPFKPFLWFIDRAY